MSKAKFKVGDYVKYGAPGGSTGRITGESSISTRVSRSWNVTWVYGKDKVGGLVSSVSNHMKEYQLMPIEKEEYEAVYNSRFNSGFKYVKAGV